MTNTHRLTARLVAIAAAAAVLSPTAAGAQAATTYTPTGGPGFSFIGTNISFTDIPAGQTIACPQFNLSGSVVSSGVSRPYGANAADLSALTSGGCTSPALGSVSINPAGAWGFTITGDPTGSVWPARITNLSADVVSGGCSFDMAGTVAGTFNESTQVFDPVSGPSGLTITTTPVGAICPLAGFELGDAIEVGGIFTVSPPLDISNP